MSHAGCKMPTPSQAHCASCHHTFAGVWGFDQHRKHGACIHPARLGMVEVERVWRMPRTRTLGHWKTGSAGDSEPRRSTGDAA